MKEPIEKPLDNKNGIKTLIMLVAGIGITAFLFYSLMQAAESGNLLMVILLAVSVSFVAFLIGKLVKNQLMKEL